MTRSLLSIALSSLLAAAPTAEDAPPAPPPAADKVDRADVAADINNPREGARQISFDAREGTWMSVDVSPDGKELHNAAGPARSADGRYVYYAGRAERFNYIPDLQSGLWQIYRYDRLTQESVKITTGFGGAARPALSPDGKAMAFVTRRDE